MRVSSCIASWVQATCSLILTLSKRISSLKSKTFVFILGEQAAIITESSFSVSISLLIRFSPSGEHKDE